MFCRHEWEVLVNESMPSAYEQMTKNALVTDMKAANVFYFAKKHIVILACKKCGAINKTVTTNP